MASFVGQTNEAIGRKPHQAIILSAVLELASFRDFVSDRAALGCPVRCAVHMAWLGVANQTDCREGWPIGFVFGQTNEALGRNPHQAIILSAVLELASFRDFVSDRAALGCPVRCAVPMAWLVVANQTDCREGGPIGFVFGQTNEALGRNPHQAIILSAVLELASFRDFVSDRAALGCPVRCAVHMAWLVVANQTDCRKGLANWLRFGQTNEALGRNPHQAIILSAVLKLASFRNFVVAGSQWATPQTRPPDLRGTASFISGSNRTVPPGLFSSTAQHDAKPTPQGRTCDRLHNKEDKRFRRQKKVLSKQEKDERTSF